eukprot:474162_1
MAIDTNDDENKDENEDESEDKKQLKSIEIFWSKPGGIYRDCVLNDYGLVAYILYFCSLWDIIKNIALTSKYFLMSYGFMVYAYGDVRRYYIKYVEPKITFGEFQLLNWKYLKDHQISPLEKEINKNLICYWQTSFGDLKKIMDGMLDTEGMLTLGEISQKVAIKYNINPNYLKDGYFYKVWQWYRDNKLN